MYITKLEIENFMSIGRAEIEFDESNIIDLCGYNDSGKSAVVRLLNIMLYFSYFREQAKFIKDGESYFKGVLHFSDGVEYEFKKLASGQSLLTLSKDNNILYSNTSGSSIVSVSDIPKPIADYLGVVKDEVTGEKLNIRRCADRLFLIDTSGGDNYKILNVILQSDVLADTSSALNTDKNKLLTEISVLSNQISAIKSESNAIHTVAEDKLDSLEEALKSFKTKKLVYKEVSQMENCIQIIENTIIPDELPVISLEQFNILSKMISLQEKTTISIPDELQVLSAERLSELNKIIGVQNRSNIFVPEQLIEVDSSRYDSIKRICGVSERLSKLSKEVGVEFKAIDATRYSQIDTIDALVQSVRSLSNDIKMNDNELSSKRDRLHILCKENNIACCPECGAVFKEEG